MAMIKKLITSTSVRQRSGSSHPKVFIGKGVLKICSIFTGEHPCRSVISIKLLCNFIEITLRHGCSPVNLLHIFRTSFLKNTSGWLLLEMLIREQYPRITPRYNIKNQPKTIAIAITTKK